MKTRIVSIIILMIGLALTAINLAPSIIAQTEHNPTAGVGTAFTYQGILTDGNSSANGSYDLQFRLYDAAIGGNQIGTIITSNDQAVSDGLLAVVLDFGENVFSGNSRYLEIRVRPGASSGSYETLAERQPLTASPYAIHAGTANALATEMLAPTGVAATPASGGSLSQGTYYFKIVSSDGVGTSIGSSEVSCTVNGSSTNRCTLIWDAVAGAASYRIYKGATSNGQNLYKTATTNSYNYDTDSGSTAGTVPTMATAFVNSLKPSGNSWLLGGNLGLGTTNPTEVLDVAGNVKIEGNLEVIGTSSTGPHFITPVTVASGTGTVAWTTFNASAYIPVNTTSVILEAEADDNSAISEGYIKIRRDSTSPIYVLLKGRTASVCCVSWASQGIFPHSNRSFQFTIDTNGFNGSFIIRLIGYFN